MHGQKPSKKNISERLTKVVHGGQQDIESICSFLGENKELKKNYALILQQGLSNAQGGDVFAFVLGHENGQVLLDLTTVQAKNWTRTRYKSAMNQAAKSVGVHVSQNTSVESDTGSADYSYQATLTLLHQVAATVGVTEGNAKLGKRVIAFVCSHKNRSATDHKDLHGKVELWTREMLEPCISAVKVVAPDEDDAMDAIGEDLSECHSGQESKYE